MKNCIVNVEMIKINNSEGVRRVPFHLQVQY